jgi:hypothetical protein
MRATEIQNPAAMGRRHHCAANAHIPALVYERYSSSSFDLTDKIAADWVRAPHAFGIPLPLKRNFFTRRVGNSSNTVTSKNINLLICVSS